MSFNVQLKILQKDFSLEILSDFDILKWEIEKIESSLTDYCELMQLQKRMFLNCRLCLPQVALSLMIVAVSLFHLRLRSVCSNYIHVDLLI